MFFFYRVLAYDYESLQFIADFKTTAKDPNALYFVSSRFQKFFLKNVNPLEVNTRIMRIGNVVESSHPNSFSQSGLTFNHFQHNSLTPISFPNVPPTTPPFPFVTPSSSYSHLYQQAPLNALPPPSPSLSYHPAQPTAAFAQALTSKPEASVYSYAQHFPQTAYVPPGTSSLNFPFLQQSPERNFFKLTPTIHHKFEHFNPEDKKNHLPFKQLNTGKAFLTVEFTNIS